MLKAAFLLLRLLTGIASLAALAATVVVIVAISLFGIVKAGVGTAVGLTKMFASGFRDSATPPPGGHLIPLPIVGLAILFIATFASVFTPRTRIFLHIVAAMALIAAAWRIWVMVRTVDHSALYLPALAVWFAYYAFCLWRLRATHPLISPQINQ